MPFVVKKGGRVQETGAKEIPLAFTKENLRILLSDITNDNAIYSHQDFTNWVSQFHTYCIQSFDKGKQVEYELENLLLDIDTQWDLYLFNTYTVNELLKLDLSKVQLPKELLHNWWTKLNSK